MADKAYYVFVPKDPDDPGERSIVSRDEGAYVRTDPKRLCKMQYQFFSFDRSSFDKRRELIPEPGVEGLLRKGFPLPRSEQVFEHEVDGHDDILKMSFDVGNVITEHVFSTFKHLRDAIRLIQDGETALADSELRLFISLLMQGCYSLAEKFSAIDDQNTELQTEASKAVNEAASARREAREKAALADKVLKTAQLESEENKLDWANAALDINKQLGRLKGFSASLEARLKSLRTAFARSQSDLDPSEASIAEQVGALRASIPTLKAFVEKPEGDVTLVRSVVSQAASALDTLLTTYLGVEREEFRAVATEAGRIAREMQDATPGEEQLLHNALTIFARFHDSYIDKKRRWTGKDIQPFLPYEVESGFSDIITEKEYDSALYCLSDPNYVSTVREQIERLVLDISEQADQEPGYPQALESELVEARSIIQQATRLLNAIEALAIDEEAVIPAEETKQDVAPADVRMNEADPVNLTPMTEPEVHPPIPEPVMILVAETSTVGTPELSPCPLGLMLGESMGLTGCGVPSLTEVEVAEVKPAPLEPEVIPDSVPTEEPDPPTVSTIEDIPPTPVLIQVVEESTPAVEAPIDPFTVVRDFFLMAGVVMTNHTGSFYSGQSYIRVYDLAQELMTLRLGSAPRISAVEAERDIRAWVFTDDQHQRVEKVAGYNAVIMSMWQNCTKPWIVYRLSKRRQECFKTTKAALPAAEALARKYGFDLNEDIAAFTAKRLASKSTDDATSSDEAPTADPTPAAARESAEGTKTATLAAERVKEIKELLLGIGYAVLQCREAKAHSLDQMLNALSLTGYLADEEKTPESMSEIWLSMRGSVLFSGREEATTRTFWTATHENGTFLLSLHPQQMQRAETARLRHGIDPAIILEALKAYEV